MLLCRNSAKRIACSSTMRLLPEVERKYKIPCVAAPFCNSAEMLPIIPTAGEVFLSKRVPSGVIRSCWDLASALDGLQLRPKLNSAYE